MTSNPERRSTPRGSVRLEAGMSVVRKASRGVGVIFLAGAVGGLCGYSDGALAAEQPTTPVSTDVVPTPRRPDSVRRAGEGLEEITISARKREEKLQDAPLSVTAFSATALRNGDVVRADDLTRFTPNLKLEV